MAQTKATKKFEKNHLKDVIRKRKENAKIKQKKQMATKRKERNARDNAPADPVENGKPLDGKSKEKENDFGDMSMDQFFAGGFEVPDMPKKGGAKPKTGKRKRTPVEDDASSDSEQDVAEPSLGAEESGSGSDSGDDMEAHKEQLAALASKDPEFYKYLQENDAELLDFAETADLAEVDALSASEDEETPRKKLKSEKASKEHAGLDNEVTKALVKKWNSSMETAYSLRAMKEVVLAFRTAAHLNEDNGKEYKYSISDSDVYHQLLVTALRNVPKVLQHHMPVKENAAGRVRVPTDTKKFRTLTPLLKSHTVSIHHLLENLSDAATLRMTLDSLLLLLPYILSFKKVVREVAKTVSSVWSDSSNTEVTRLAAFLVLRKLIVIGDAGIREVVLKQTYQGLIKGARNTTVHTIHGINLMKNTAAELWGLDANVGYTTGFTFIRQLAIHLRSSITNKTKDSYKTVYNWQYVHSLDFWSRVVSAHCESFREAEAGKESALRPLIYPIVQVTLGAMRLIPTATYFPLRFQLIRSLLRISSATSTYIPLAPVLVEVLNSAEMKKPAKPSTLKPLDFSTSIRAAKSFLRTRTYQDGVGEQVAELLSEFFVQWTKNIAFPELSLPVVVMLKRWAKDMSRKSGGNRNGKVNSAITLLIQKLDANARWIEGKRAKVEFAPNDRTGVDNFLKGEDWEKTPLGAYVAGQRKSREQKAKVLEDARKADDKKRRAAEAADAREHAEAFGGSESEDDDEDDEEEVDGMSVDGIEEDSDEDSE